VKFPSWILPVVILLLTGVALNLTMAHHVNWREVSKEQIAKSKWASSQFDRLDDAKKQEAYERAATQAKVGRYVRAFVGWPLALLIASLIYLGAYRLIGGARLGYGLAFTIIAWAQLPMAIRELLGTLVTVLKDPSTIDPENYIATNPAAFLSSDLPTWQMVPLAFLDIFGIWVVILIATGFSAADPKKVPFGKSLGIAIGLQLFFMAFFTMIAWVFS